MGVVKNLMVRVGADLSGLNAGFNKAAKAPENFKKKTQKAMQESAASMANLKKAMAQGGKNPKIVSLVDQIRELEAEQKALSNAGFSWGYEGFEGNERLLRSLKSELKAYTDGLHSAGDAAEESMDDAAGSARNFGAAAKTAFGNVKTKAKELASGGLRLVGNGLKSLGRAGLSGLKGILSHVTGIGSNTRSLSGSIGGLTSALKRVGLAAIGIKLTYAMFGRLRSIVSSYISENAALQAQVNSLKSGLGQALAPAINLVTNALSYLMPYIVGVSNAIGSLITNLFGSGWTTVAQGASEAASATGAATDAQKEYNRTLAGFDEITKLSSSAGSSGSGGSTEASTTQTAGKLPGWLTDLSTQIKEAVSQGDYEGVGAILAEKLGNAVDWARAKLNDSSFKARVKTLTDNAASIINGFFGTLTVDPSASGSIAENVGALIGDGIVLGLSTADQFLDSIDFGNIGKCMAQGINGAISSLKESDSNLGSTIASFIQGGIDAASGFIAELDWAGLGTVITENLKGLTSCFDIKSLAESWGASFGDWFTDAFPVILEEIVSIKEYWDQYIADAGGDFSLGVTMGIADGIANAFANIGSLGFNIITGIYNGILDAINGIGSWIKENIFTPFVEGFKSTFQIHSPSKHKDITSLGFNIIAGIFNGILEALSDPVGWIKKNVFKPLKEGFANAFGDGGFSIKVGAKLTSWKDSLKEKVVSFTAKLSKWKDSLKEKSIKFTAKLSKWKDSLKEKSVKFTARLSKWKDSLKDKAVKFTAKFTTWKDNLKDKTSKFTAKFTSWKDALSNKYLDFKANIKKGWVGSIADALGISTITSKLNMKLPKISIDWGETTIFSKTFRYPKGFSIKWNAKGAIMNGATIFGGYGNTLFGGGEAGREALLPLDRNTGWMDKIAERVALKVITAQGSNQEIIINLVLDGKIVARTVVKHVNAQAKATGTHPFAAYI